MKRVAWLLVAAWMAGSAGGSQAVRAEEGAGEPLQMAALQAVPAEDIRTVIAGLSSLKDYDRLRWILTSIEAQPSEHREALWRALDQQIDQLMGISAGGDDSGVSEVASEPTQAEVMPTESISVDPSLSDPSVSTVEGSTNFSSGDMPLRLPSWKRQGGGQP